MYSEIVCLFFSDLETYKKTVAWTELASPALGKCNVEECDD